MFRATLKKATASYEGGNYQKALAQLNEVLARTPDRIPALTLRGETKLRLNDRHGAFKDFRRVVEIDKNNVLALSKCGEIYYEYCNFYEAITVFDRTLQLEPQNFYALSKRGATHYQLGNLAAALHDIEAALFIMPHDLFTLECHVKIKRTVKDKVEKLNELGRGKYYEFKYNDALREFALALELDPKNIFALEWSAESKYMLGQFQEALRDCNTILGVKRVYSRVDAFALHVRGKIYYKLHRFHDAIADLEQAIKAGLNNGIAFYYCAEIQYMLQEYRQALLNFDKALMLNFNPEVVLIGRAKTKVRLGDLHGALTDIITADRRLPNDPEIIQINREVQQKIQTTRLHADRDRAAKVNSLRKSSERHWRTGNLDQAYTDINQALRLQPNDTAARQIRIEVGHAVDDRNEKERLIKEHERAAAKAATLFDKIVFLKDSGEKYYQAGNFDQALINIDEVLQLLDSHRWGEEFRKEVYHWGRDRAARIQTAQAKATVDKIDTLKEEAEAHFQAGRNQEAKNILNQALVLAPRNAELLFKRGKVNASIFGGVAAALKDFTDALASTPRNIELLYNRGIAYSVQRDGAVNALKDFNAILVLDSDHVPSLLAIAEINLKQCNLSEAQKYIERAFRIKPTDYWVLDAKRKLEEKLNYTVAPEPKVESISYREPSPVRPSSPLPVFMPVPAEQVWYIDGSEDVAAAKKYYKRQQEKLKDAKISEPDKVRHYEAKVADAEKDYRKLKSKWG